VIHLFHHSHTDEGWIAKTDDFFTGKDTSVYPGSVRDILDTTVLELLKDQNRTFTFAEIKYFRMWWELQDKVMREKVRGLVKRGQLDLVSGGWSAPDEAVTSYDQILDNFMIAQQFLQKEFDHHTKVSW
jgi:alpha-mannosidase